MKNKYIMISILLIICFSAGFSQDIPVQKSKSKQKQELQSNTEALIHSGNFVFTPRTLIPQSGSAIHVSNGSYSVVFKPELITSHLPFYGRAYSAISYGGDAGMKFEGKPEEYQMTLKKKGYEVNTQVKGSNDLYRLKLSVGTGGNASLTIISNNRSSISYNGIISASDEGNQ